MSLKNWFSYLKENIKKSKSLIILILTIIPLLSGIVMLFFENAMGGANIPSLIEISIVAIVGMFIVPIVITNLLFGYVYKKKSVDFVNSMPISRKGVFVANTVGGILIIGLLILLNVVVMFITVKIFTNSLLHYSILIDYFVLWFVSYVFVFCLSNVAMALSGNLITQIIVSIILICFIPFTTDYLTDYFGFGFKETYIELSESESENITYYCYDNTNCAEKKLDGLYHIDLAEEKGNTYNLPYSMIIKNMFGSFKLYDENTIFSMCIMSLIYIIVGFYLFLNRKMEVTETTFKTYAVHTFVKCITMYPFALFIFEYIFSEGVHNVIWILIILMVGYYYVYDLITRKGIQSFSKSLVYLMAFVFVTFSISYLVSNNRSGEEVIKLEEVSTVSMNINDGELVINGIDEEVVVKNAIYEQYNSCFYEDGCHDAKMTFNIDGREYSSYMSISEEYYNELKNDIVRYDLSEYVYKVDYDKTLAISIDGVLFDAKKHKDFIKMLKNSEVDNTKEEVFYSGFVKLYYYEDHELKNINVSTSDEDVANYIGVFSNSRVVKELGNISEGSVYVSVAHDEFDYSYSYLVDYYMGEIINYLKENAVNEFNSNEDYVRLYIGEYSSNFSGVYFENNVSRFYQFLDELKEKAKDNPEYLEYLKDYYGDAYEYID